MTARPPDPLWPTAQAWLSDGEHPGGPASLGVVGVPLSVTSLSPSGAHETPQAVRAALRRFSPFSSRTGGSLADLPVQDFGDLALTSLPAEPALAAIEAGVRALPEVELLVLQGGDNALTRPALRALATRLDRVALLTLDAHHDVRGFHAGPTNGTPVRGLVDDGLPAGSVVQVGIGEYTNSSAYRQWCDDRGIVVVTAAQARREGVGACVRRQLDGLALAADWVYVDLDVDVVDAAFAPGCPGARPGGLAPHELFDAAFEAGRHPAVRAVDIVEVDATADRAGRTVDLAAHALLSTATGLLARRAPGVP